MLLYFLSTVTLVQSLEETTIYLVCSLVQYFIFKLIADNVQLYFSL